MMNATGPHVSNAPVVPREARQLALEVPAIPSSELLRGQSHVPIEHGGAVYWLRATRSGKLILTK